jgi:hypothetical protein
VSWVLRFCALGCEFAEDEKYYAIVDIVFLKHQRKTPIVGFEKKFPETILFVVPTITILA